MVLQSDYSSRTLQTCLDSPRLFIKEWLWGANLSVLFKHVWLTVNIYRRITLIIKWLCTTRSNSHVSYLSKVVVYFRRILESPYWTLPNFNKLLIFPCNKHLVTSKAEMCYLISTTIFCSPHWVLPKDSIFNRRTNQNLRP